MQTEFRWTLSSWLEFKETSRNRWELIPVTGMGAWYSLHNIFYFFFIFLRYPVIAVFFLRIWATTVFFIYFFWYTYACWHLLSIWSFFCYVEILTSSFEFLYRLGKEWKGSKICWVGEVVSSCCARMARKLSQCYDGTVSSQAVQVVFTKCPHSHTSGCLK